MEQEEEKWRLGWYEKKFNELHNKHEIFTHTMEKFIQFDFSRAESELSKPTIKEVSFEQVYTILQGFSKFISKVAPEKQKDLLHSIINKITVNAGNKPDERSVKDIELFFDASFREDFVLTCDTVQLNAHNGEKARGACRSSSFFVCMVTNASVSSIVTLRALSHSHTGGQILGEQHTFSL